jgi:hypothetical protein
MSAYVLILVAKRNDVGSYRYSASIFQAEGTDDRARQMNFESESEFRLRVNALLGGGADVSDLLPQLHREGNYWLESVITMSDEQAAHFGWIT